MKHEWRLLFGLLILLTVMITPAIGIDNTADNADPMREEWFNEVRISCVEPLLACVPEKV